MENNKTNKNELTSAEWKIYNYLKERTQNGLWTNQQELIEYLEAQKIKVGKRELRRYIQNIRKSNTIQKIILTSYKKGYIIMSDENQVEILIKRKISILKSLKQYHRDIKRLKLNNQFKLKLDNQEREIIESLLKIGVVNESNMSNV